MILDIFCTVIDNYGDIGVTWRLARQLAAEHAVAVRLWVDDLEAFRHIRPEVDPTREVQHLAVQRVPIGAPHREWSTEKDQSAGMAHACAEIPPSPPFTKGGEPRGASVEIRRWTSPFPPVIPGDVVIEALACNLPEDFMAAMAAREPKPLWLNLEYLTAEDWARGVHGLPSPHPRLPLVKYFFMPGYTPDSGGLTREAWLAEERAAFQADPAARNRFWSALGIPAETPEELRVSLFAYENAALAGLLSAWRAGNRPVRVLLPTGKALPEVARWFGLAAVPAPGTLLHRGHLSLHVLPMLDQDTYDRLLWACDLNFVRGEDSFVRAQLADRPLVWQAYRQEEEAHFAKLAAFLDLYCAAMPADLAGLTRAAWETWNREGDLAALWPAWLAALPDLGQAARHWRECLEKQPDQASNLMIFCKKKLE
ncbi:MAG: elongation factor P maturation arginine rhamnosyltransferase EarP [Pseudomonadota bacterium]